MRGNLIADYQLDAVQPEGWAEAGIELVQTVDWDGSAPQLLAVKERHERGDVAILDAMTGWFLQRFPEEADRLYVVDVCGDSREELVVLSGHELHIYHNPQPNPNPWRPRWWTHRQYRRSKMTWNYSSQ